MEIRNLINSGIIYKDNSSTIKNCLMNAARERADLRGSNLRGSNLRGSDLRGSDLSWCDLSESNLSESNLRGSDLRGSDLRGSNLSESDLRRSDLRGSDLSESDLRGSNLSWCNLSGSIGLDYAQISFNGFGERNRLISLVDINRDGNPIFFCGCFKGTNEELIDYIDYSDEGYKESRYFARKTLFEMIKFSNNKNK